MAFWILSVMLYEAARWKMLMHEFLETGHAGLVWLALALIVLLFVSYSSLNILTWRLRLTGTSIEIRNIRGILTRKLASIERMDRSYGRLSLMFEDKKRVVLPIIIGDLDALSAHLSARIEPSRQSGQV